MSRERTEQTTTSALEEQRADWLGSHFWDPFDRLENHRAPVQSDRGDLGTDDLRLVWRGYSAAIAELEQTTEQ